MVTGASTAELALVLIDARHGVVEQTRRHLAVAALLRVPHVALAVNKMDLVDCDERGLRRHRRAEFAAVARLLGVDDVLAIPLSALHGDNVVDRSAHTRLVRRPDRCSSTSRPSRSASDPAPSRSASRCSTSSGRRRAEHRDYRGYAGRSPRASCASATRSSSCPSGRTHDGRRRSTALERAARRTAFAPQSVVAPPDRRPRRLARRPDRAADDAAATPSQDIEGDVCVLVRPRRCAAGDRVLRACTAPARCGPRRGVVDALDIAPCSVGVRRRARALNEIGRLTLRLAEPVAADDYSTLRRTGAFLLVDEADGTTLAAGMAVVARCIED